MASTYQCIVCQKLSMSLMDLHNHHVQNHTLEELSESVINLHSLQILNNCMPKKGEAFSIHDYNGNQQENHSTQSIKKRGGARSRSVSKIASSEYVMEKMINHDETHCLANCTEFIPWELEWNKSLKIDDNEFFYSIDQLCTDLQNRKGKSRRRKHQAIESNTAVEKMMDITNKLEQNANSEGTEIHSQTSLPTSSFSNHTNTNQVLNSTLKNKVLQVQFENDGNQTSKNREPLMYSTLHESIFIFGEVNENLPWAPCAGNSIQTETTSSKEMDSINKTICYKTDGCQ